MGVEKQRAIEKRNGRAKKREKVILGGGEEYLDSVVDWRAVDWDWAIPIIIRIHDANGAVMLTKSKDGGALGIRIYHDLVEAKTYYFRPDDTATMRKLEGIIDELESLARD